MNYYAIDYVADNLCGELGHVICCSSEKEAKSKLIWVRETYESRKLKRYKSYRHIVSKSDVQNPSSRSNYAEKYGIDLKDLKIHPSNRGDAWVEVEIDAPVFGLV